MRSPPPPLACAFTLLTVFGSATTLSAQAVPDARFSVNRFTPAPGIGNYLQVDGAQVGGHLTVSAGLTLDYAHEPFVLYNASCTDASETNCEVGSTNTELVSYIAAAHLYGAIALVDRVQIGLNLPLLLSNGDGFSTFVRGMPVEIPGGTRFAVGDPTLSVKARIYGEGQGISLAASVFATAPIANQIDDGGFLGDESLRVGGQFIAQFIQDGFHLSVNVGGYYAPKRTLFSTTAGSAVTFRAAVGYEVTPLVLVFAEIDGASGLSTELDETPLEARLAGRLRQGDFTFTVAGGAGVISGLGVPVFRALAGFAYSPQRGDRDGDGIEDAADACPTEPEDMDGWEDSDGCPDVDNDGDGMLDGVDPCPDEAEDMDGFEDEDGCPDRDNDGDGIADGFDSCPNDVEDMDGDRDDDGCPDDDTDRDGIDDVNDQCPNEPEDMDGYGDEDGCPEDDFDGDGIPDDADECPDQPETFNGIADEDGCPEPDGDGDGIVDEQDRCPEEPETLNGERDDDGCPDGDALIRVEGESIVLLQQIQFANARARIRGRRSENIIAAIGTILGRNPQYRVVRIEGHTDSAGDAATNQRLSLQRAEAVKAALVARGIDASRMNAVGIGADRPLGDNETEEGREQNRRVEIHIDSGPSSTPR